MRPLQKVCAFACAFTLLLGTVAVTTPQAGAVQAAGADKLLTGNTVGGALFAADTQVISTGASYSWLTEGTNATDPALLASDDAAVPDLTDGGNGPDEGYSSSTGQAAGTAAAGTVIFDLKSVYKVSAVKVWAETEADSSMAGFEVYASMDSLNYNRLGTADNTNGEGSGFAEVSFSVKPAVYARYVKVIMRKDPAKEQMRLGEAAVFGNTLEPMALLSNNYLRATGPYNTSVPKLATNASYEWVTDQPFVTNGDLIKTDNDSRNDEGGGIPDMIDGSSTETDSKYTANSVWWNGAGTNRFGTVLFNLNDVYQIGKIDVWSLAASNKYMDGYEVLVSTDGVNYSTLGYTSNPNSRPAAAAMVNTVSYGVPGKLAKYVKIIMHSSNEANLLQLGEIAIWGWRVYDPNLPKNAVPDRVEFRADRKNYTTVYLDWSGYNSVVNNVNKYAVYMEPVNFTTTEGLTPKFTAESRSVEQTGKFLSYTGLEPDTAYYIAITPFHSAGGERKDVSTVKIKTSSVLGGEKAGDIFAVNDAPYGGGNYVHHGENEDLFLMNKLNLLREIGGINKNRWWDHSGAMKELYAKSGLHFHYFYHGPGYLASDNKKGAYTFSTYNEPDLANRDPAAVAAKIKENHDSLKAASSKSLLLEPALAGIDRNTTGGLNWLDQFYESDGRNGALVKTYFDVMDVHPYVKYEYPAVPGLEQGAPEKLIEKIAELKAVMESHGDGDKPITFTEIGWSTYTGGSYLKKVDRATQRNYLARAYMHAIAGGIKTMHWYDFADDGTEANNLEHNLGLIDWYGKPKDSYYGYYTMVRVLKDAEYLGAVGNAANPYYGYRFWDETKNRYITSLWDASWTTTTATAPKVAKVATPEAGLMTVGIDGSYKYLPASGGIVNVALTGAPVFIYSNSGVTVNSVN